MKHGQVFSLCNKENILLSEMLRPILIQIYSLCFYIQVVLVKNVNNKKIVT